jgi:hypothetical protein
VAREICGYWSFDDSAGGLGFAFCGSVIHKSLVHDARHAITGRAAMVFRSRSGTVCSPNGSCGLEMDRLRRSRLALHSEPPGPTLCMPEVSTSNETTQPGEVLI